MCESRSCPCTDAETRHASLVQLSWLCPLQLLVEIRSVPAEPRAHPKKCCANASSLFLGYRSFCLQQKKKYNQDMYLFQCRTHYLRYYKFKNIVCVILLLYYLCIIYRIYHLGILWLLLFLFQGMAVVDTEHGQAICTRAVLTPAEVRPSWGNIYS